MNQSTWPQFNLKPYCFGTEMLQEFLFSLAENNNNRVNNCELFSGYFKTSYVAAFIFEMSERFDLDNESKFLAIEVFDRFMVFHLKEIHEAIKRNNCKDWNLIVQKIQDQIILRSLTCIQLANKFNNGENVIKLSSIRELLAELGYKYSFESILNSELRVLKYLDYRLKIITPYNAIETLLEILGHNLKNSEPKVLFIIAIRLLESFYFSKEIIYQKLYESYSGKCQLQTDQKQLKMLENDCIFLSSALICSSARIISKNESKYYEKILDSLCNICQLEKSDVDEFSQILCRFSLSEF